MVELNNLGSPFCDLVGLEVCFQVLCHILTIHKIFYQLEFWVALFTL